MNQHRYTNRLYIRPNQKPTRMQGILMLLGAGVFGFVAACLYGVAGAI